MSPSFSLVCCHPVPSIPLQYPHVGWFSLSSSMSCLPMARLSSCFELRFLFPCPKLGIRGMLVAVFQSPASIEAYVSRQHQPSRCIWLTGWPFTSLFCLLWLEFRIQVRFCYRRVTNAPSIPSINGNNALLTGLRGFRLLVHLLGAIPRILRKTNV